MPRTGRSVRTRARAAILAMPHFIARRVAPGDVRASDAFTYAPWIVANVTVDRLPQGRGAALAWDNVSATGNSLGYVVATHQGPAAIAAGTVLTWYLPLSSMAPAEGRRLLLERPVEQWQRLIEDELLEMHPDLAGAIRSIDVWRWAHAMVRPTPGPDLGRGARGGGGRAASVPRPFRHERRVAVRGGPLSRRRRRRGGDAPSRPPA